MKLKNNLIFLNIYFLLFTSCRIITALELNLNQLTKYASSLPEYPDQEKQDRRRTVRNVINNVAATLGLKKGAYFSASDFEKILQKVLEGRSVYYMQGRLVEKIMPEIGSTCIVWGELNGAFHSLVRDLAELHKQGCMSNDLVISDMYYYIFNGDVIGESVYALETFMLVLYLMYKNPKRVLYIKGNNEDKEHWKESLFARQIQELKMSLWSNKNAHMPAQELRSFFNSLPLALYVLPSDQVDQGKKKVVRFSYYAPDYAELDEMTFSYFFDRYAPSVISLLDKNRSSATDYQILAYIYVEPDKTAYAPSEGLLLKSKNNSNIFWTTISSPTLAFGKQFQFFNDAFVGVKISESIDTWTITLSYQDVRKLTGFKQEGTFYLLSGDRVYDPLQAKVKQLERKLQELNTIKQELYDNCLSDISMPKKDEDILSFIKRRNWQQLTCC